MCRLVLAVSLAFVLSGCRLSMNVQLANLNGGGQVSTAIALDAVGSDKLATAKAQTKEIAQQILDFINSGSVAELTKGALKDELLALVPAKYRGVVESALGYVSVKDVNIDAIGTNNVLRMSAYLTGVVAECDAYLDEFHPVEEVE